MQVAIYGLIRSGTTLLADKLTVRGRSLILDEPDPHVPWSGLTVRHVSAQLREFGFAVDDGELEREKLGTLEAFFEKIVVPRVSTLPFWGIKMVDFSHWEQILARHPPVRLVLCVRDLRDVVLSAFDLQARGRFTSPMTGRPRDENWIRDRILASSRALIAMSQRDHKVLRYEDLCTEPSILDQVVEYAGTGAMGDERLMLQTGSAQRQYELAKHGTGISSRSVFRHRSEPAGPAMALADHVWRSAPEFSRLFGYEVPGGLAPSDRTPGARRSGELFDRSRARAAAASCVPSGSRVLDLASGTSGLEFDLPPGCEYVPLDVGAREDRSVVCDFYSSPLPALDPPPTMMVAAGSLEHAPDVPGLLTRLRAANRPLVVAYHTTERVPPEARRRAGWKSHLDGDELARALEAADFHVRARFTAEGDSTVMVADPAARARIRRPKVVVVVPPGASLLEERAGCQRVGELLPAETEIVFVRQKNLPDANRFDLVIFGVGASVDRSVTLDTLLPWMAPIPQRAGIFGTMGRQARDRAQWKPFLEALPLWYARTSEDLLFHGGAPGRTLLGDWFLAGFPMVPWRTKETFTLETTKPGEDPQALTEFRKVQTFRRVETANRHGLTCALSSAQEVVYLEKDPAKQDRILRALCLDVFGRSLPAGRPFRVDRDAVAEYRARVRAAVADLRKSLQERLCIV